MAECGNVTSFARSQGIRALGLDIGSTHAKAAVVTLDDRMHELAVAQRPVAGLDGRALVEAALQAAREALSIAGGSVAVVGIASMAETGALVGADGVPGALVRWDRASEPAARLALARGLDPVELHALTGAPLVPKLPLLAWAELARDGIPRGARWAFAADLVVAALTGRIATDHTLAGRSGAYPLPPAGERLSAGWHDGLLAEVGVPSSLLPEIVLPGASAGIVGAGILPGAAGAPVYVAGHDHAVAARLAGIRPGRAVHSLGTTEAVLALAADGTAIDRPAAAAEGMSVTRAVDGQREGVLAGSPAAGSLIARWRATAGPDADALLAARPDTPADALALPYPHGRQSPAPRPGASLEFVRGDPGDPADGLTGILRGLAAHGAWMREIAAGLAGGADSVVAVGAPVRANPRLAALMASLAGAPLPIVDLDAPVACGAAAIAAERAGLARAVEAPVRLVRPHDDGIPDLAARFADAVSAPLTLTQGAP